MKGKLGYWIAIGVFSLMMAASAIGYVSGSAQMVETFRHLGYPDYFLTLLGVAKLLGVVALLAPRVPVVVREWAYAGFGITFVAAAISHAASGDPVVRVAAPLIALALLIAVRRLSPTHGTDREPLAALRPAANH
jgi:DoxX-like family